MSARAARVDPDFAHDIMGDLYAYRRKRRVVAWLFWAILGWMGAHRFYLERPGTGILQMLTGGGVLVWWVMDAWRIGAFVDEHNAEQARRKRAGEPPLELAFMPPRSRDALTEPPAWTVRWKARGRAWRAMRLVGDLLVLTVSGAALGALAGTDGGTEGVVAVVVLIAVTLLGGRAHALNEMPVARSLLRWSHRLRLFYYINQPGSPLALMVRGVTVMILAPFRRRDRAEVSLYLEIGAAFTLFFVAADIIEEVVVPLAGNGVSAISPLRLAGVLIQEVVLTFLVIYTFVAPIGAVLSLYLLTRPTHTMARLLGGFTLLLIALGSGVL